MFLEEMQAYFWAERQGAAIGAMLGSAILLASIFLRKRFWTTPVRKGFYLAMIFIAVTGLASAFSIYNNTAKIETFMDAYEENPEEVLTQEIDRMSRVNSWSAPLKLSWITVLLVGLGGVLFKHKGVWTGLAIGLIIMAALALMVDVWAKWNAVRYTKSLYNEQLRLEEPS